MGSIQYIHKDFSSSYFSNMLIVSDGDPVISHGKHQKTWSGEKHY